MKSETVEIIRMLREEAQDYRQQNNPAVADVLEKEARAIQNRFEIPIGATGEYPHGKICPEDEGGIAFRIYAGNNTVFLDFGKSISWFGLSPINARELAAMLLKYAEIAEKTR